MDLTTFLKQYKVTADAGNVPMPAHLGKVLDADFQYCLNQLGGKTFHNGLYRVYRWDQIAKYSQIVGKMFAAVDRKCAVFASDWLGRQFAVDFTEILDGKPSITCFDFGTPETFTTDTPILVFHNQDLTEKADITIEPVFFQQWWASNPTPIGFDQCISYKNPLFLGGEKTVDNLDVTDLEVHLEIMSQLWEQVKDLPEGTPIGEIRIDGDDE